MVHTGFAGNCLLQTALDICIRSHHAGRVTVQFSEMSSSSLYLFLLSFSYRQKRWVLSVGFQIQFLFPCTGLDSDIFFILSLTIHKQLPKHYVDQ